YLRWLQCCQSEGREVRSVEYGGGLRLGEVIGLRVKDVDPVREQITVRCGKGDRDRITVLPKRVIPLLKEALAGARVLFDQDRAKRTPGVALPIALERKMSRCRERWEWFCEAGFQPVVEIGDGQGEPGGIHGDENMVENGQLEPLEVNPSEELAGGLDGGDRDEEHKMNFGCCNPKRRCRPAKAARSNDAHSAEQVWAFSGTLLMRIRQDAERCR
ncbi:MAG: tyrosine-type recombinase/integrase, partial [Verrucomicrobiota bacterium]